MSEPYPHAACVTRHAPRASAFACERMRRARPGEPRSGSALVLLVALAFAATVAAGVRIPGVDLARAIAARIVCAAGLGDGCAARPVRSSLAYGPELAGLVAEHAPGLDYEEGMRAVPVDFRSCREDACADGPEAGPVSRVARGRAGHRLRPRRRLPRPRGRRASTATSAPGSAAGHVYLQYWALLPGQRDGPGAAGRRRRSPGRLGVASRSGSAPDGSSRSVPARTTATTATPATGSRTRALGRERGVDAVDRASTSSPAAATRAGSARRPGRRASAGPPPAAIRLIPIEPLRRVGRLRSFAVIAALGEGRSTATRRRPGRRTSPSAEAEQPSIHSACAHQRARSSTRSGSSRSRRAASSATA